MEAGAWPEFIRGKVNSPSGQGDRKPGSDSFLEGLAKKMGLSVTSTVRTDADVKRGIGYSGDDHHKGKAMDFAGSVKDMDKFAAAAVESKKYSKVIYKGRNMMTGTKVAGHDDHVHVSWG